MKAVLKPLKKDFCKPFNDELVLFDSKGYAKQAAAYIEKLESVINLTSSNLRDIAIGLGEDHKDFSSIHQLADRLYNSTIK